MYLQRVLGLHAAPGTRVPTSTRGRGEEGRLHTRPLVQTHPLPDPSPPTPSNCLTAEIPKNLTLPCTVTSPSPQEPHLLPFLPARGPPGGAPCHLPTWPWLMGTAPLDLAAHLQSLISNVNPGVQCLLGHVREPSTAGQGGLHGPSCACARPGVLGCSRPWAPAGRMLDFTLHCPISPWSDNHQCQRHYYFMNICLLT